MTTEDTVQIKGWLDLIIKAIIGLVVSLIGWDYKNLKESLFDLQTSKYQLTTQVEVARNELTHVKNAIERIEKKLDSWQK